MDSKNNLPESYSGRCLADLAYEYTSSSFLFQALDDERWDEIIDACRQELQRPAASVEFWFLMADCLHKQGRWDEAHDALIEALTRKPGYIQALVFMGRYHLAKGRLHAAIPCLELATRLNPLSSWAWAVYSVALARKNLVVESKQAYLKAIETSGVSVPTSLLDKRIREIGDEYNVAP